jgi:hypothetical protein
MGEKYPTHGWINCINSYKTVEGSGWKRCPNCGLRPKIWIFDNGRSTVCGCWEDKYDHFSIHAESINSHASRNNGNVSEYDIDELRKNWNHWCKTGEILFEHAGKRTDGRW